MSEKNHPLENLTLKLFLVAELREIKKLISLCPAPGNRAESEFVGLDNYLLELSIKYFAEISLIEIDANTLKLWDIYTALETDSLTNKKLKSFCDGRKN